MLLDTTAGESAVPKIRYQIQWWVPGFGGSSGVCGICTHLQHHQSPSAGAWSAREAEMVPCGEGGRHSVRK